MDITEANWKKIRHKSAKDSGVAEAVKKWAKYCLDPSTLDDPAAEQAKSAAEALRVAIQKAKSKLAVDSKDAKAFQSLSKENPKDEKGKKKLAELKQVVNEAEQQIKATHELLADWDAQASKYVRAVAKSNDERKKQLEQHLTEVQDVLKMLETNFRNCSLGRKNLEEGVRSINGLSVKVEKLLTDAIQAKKTANGFALARLEKEHTKATNELKSLHSETKRVVNTVADQVRKSTPAIKPLLTNSLTGKKLQNTLQRASDKTAQEHDILVESLSAVDDAFDEVKLLLDKVELALNAGVDEVAEARDQLNRAIKRMTDQNKQAKTVVELGVGGLLEQAMLEILNLEENRPTTDEEREKAWTAADNYLRRAENNMDVAAKTIERINGLLSDVKASLPKGILDNPAGELIALVQEFEAQQEDFAKQVKSHEENESNYAKRRSKLDKLPKTL